MDVPEIAVALDGDPALRPLDLLVLHGSRARGDGHADSDWDFGYLAAEAVDPAWVTSELTRLLGTDAVDLVDLARTSALLRYRAARDGIAVLERVPGAFLAFRLEAVTFWCDAGPVIRAAQDEVLASLSRGPAR